MSRSDAERQNRTQTCRTAHGDHVALTYEPLNEQEDLDRVRDSSAGAICTFIGTTRDSFQGKTVELLEYEAYPAMALKTMSKIVCEARELCQRGAFSFAWPDYPSVQPGTANPTPPRADLINQTHSTKSVVVKLTHISLIHRLGVVPPKGSSISIAVSSPHRKEAFRACEWILEEVKKRVEVWKREVYAEGDKAWKENFPI